MVSVLVCMLLPAFCSHVLIFRVSDVYCQVRYLKTTFRVFPPSPIGKETQPKAELLQCLYVFKRTNLRRHDLWSLCCCWSRFVDILFIKFAGGSSGFSECGSHPRCFKMATKKRNKYEFFLHVRVPVVTHVGGLKILIHICRSERPSFQKFLGSCSVNRKK